MDILQQLKATEVTDVYEIAFEESSEGYREELDLSDIKKLNRAGYIYQASQTDIDYEDLNEKGETVVCYMDIHYFVKINITNVKEKMNEFFPA